MVAKKIDLGGTGETVRQNVKRLRGGMQFKELAQKLVDAGRPIPTLGLRRIEAGERRVDVDDLSALAIVFGVSPLTLLMPEDGGRLTSSHLTGMGEREVAHNAQWLWGMCQEPLTVHVEEATRGADIELFQSRSKPKIHPRRPEITYAGGGHLDTESRELLRSVGFGTEDDRQGLVYGDGND